MNDQSRVMLGAVIGAVCGAVAGYLFFTERGRQMRDRIEPSVDDLRRELLRFQKTIGKVGDLAGDGMRVMAEFKAARDQYPSPGATSH
ncbi:MAG: YtxH domain-containing protein [Vicinamibacterales bacterium]